MTTLVTGATGFLGGRLVRRYLEQGESVIALGRNEFSLEKLNALGAATVRHDLSGSLDLPPSQHVREIDTIVHCAALSSPYGARSDFHAANVLGTRHVVDLAKRLRVRRMILISTPAVYFRPRHQFGVRETDPLPVAVNHYAETKLRAEGEALRTLHEGVIILRPRGIYGPGDTALLPRLLHAVRFGPLPLMNDGQAVTDLTHVDDVIGAVLAAQGHEGRQNEILNVSGGEPVNVKRLIDRVCAHMSQEVKWRPTPVPLAMFAARAMEMKSRLTSGAEPRTTRYSLGLLAYSQTLNIEKIHTVLGWSPKISFETGLADALSSGDLE